MGRTRDWRRAHRDRKFASIKRQLEYLGLGPTPDETPEHWYLRVATRSKTPVCCSNWCCGNPRRHYRGEAALTMGEQRAPRINDWDE